MNEHDHFTGAVNIWRSTRTVRQLATALTIIAGAVTGLAKADAISEARDAVLASDWNTAVRLAGPLAKQGDLEALRIYGEALASMPGASAQNVSKGWKLVEKAAAAGNENAMFVMIRGWRLGSPGLGDRRQSDSQVKRWVKVAASQGNRVAFSMLLQDREFQDERVQMRAWVGDFCKKGFPHACVAEFHQLVDEGRALNAVYYGIAFLERSTSEMRNRDDAVMIRSALMENIYSLYRLNKVGGMLPPDPFVQAWLMLMSQSPEMEKVKPGNRYDLSGIERAGLPTPASMAEYWRYLAVLNRQNLSQDSKTSAEYIYADLAPRVLGK